MGDSFIVESQFSEIPVLDILGEEVGKGIVARFQPVFGIRIVETVIVSFQYELLSRHSGFIAFVDHDFGSGQQIHAEIFEQIYFVCGQSLYREQFATAGFEFIRTEFVEIFGNNALVQFVFIETWFGVRVGSCISLVVCEFTGEGQILYGSPFDRSV